MPETMLTHIVKGNTVCVFQSKYEITVRKILKMTYGTFLEILIY